MKFRWDNKYLHWGVTAFMVIAASMLFYYGIFHMKTLITGIKTFLGIMAPIVYGVILAYVLSPLINLMEKKLIYPLLDKREIHLQKKGRKAVRWACVLVSMLAFWDPYLYFDHDGASTADPKLHEYYLQLSLLCKGH